MVETGFLIFFNYSDTTLSVCLPAFLGAVVSGSRCPHFVFRQLEHSSRDEFIAAAKDTKDILYSGDSESILSYFLPAILALSLVSAICLALFFTPSIGNLGSLDRHLSFRHP